ncbi:MAG TPA: hypothetical protein VMV49_09910 [Candidatus Deferrimicrobium sp.]|nr:hypothetical protein [Candidatus Deferrimicrobium sp.]
MNIFKISVISTITLMSLIIPFYIMKDSISSIFLDQIFLIVSYAAVMSLILFVCIAITHIRGGFQGTRLMIGNRHLHEGTIGIVFVFTGVVWNIWHYFDASFFFPFSKYATVGWWLAVGGLVWIIIGAILIGRDWEDIKNGQFFNTEEE